MKRMFQYDTDRLPKELEVCCCSNPPYRVCEPYVFHTRGLAELAEVLYKLAGIAFYVQVNRKCFSGYESEERPYPLVYFVSREGRRLSFEHDHAHSSDNISSWKSAFYGNDPNTDRLVVELFQKGARFWYWKYPEPVEVATGIPIIPPFSSVPELKMKLQLAGHEV